MLGFKNMFGLKNMRLFQGNKRLSVNKKIPMFQARDTANRVHTHLSHLGKRVVISTFPDINTSVCNIQTRQIIAYLASMEDVVLLNVSTNSEQAFANWCANEGLDAITISDCKGTVAKRFGLWIPLIQKYSRAIIVIDPTGYVTYLEKVTPITKEPDYSRLMGHLTK